MTDYVITKAEIKDAEAVSKLIKEAMGTYASNSHIPNNRLESMTESIETVIDRIKNNNCLLITDGTKPVGTITLSVVNNPMKYAFSKKSEKYLSNFSKVGYISRFAVSKELRKTGMGISLINEAIKNAEEALCDLVILHSSIDNKSLKNFYANRGFIVIDSESSRGYNRGLLGLPITKSE